MSKMIPAVISPDTSSNAEKKMFYLFKNAPGTSDWVVFHSLGVERHLTHMRGEVDFLVCAPALGVFVIEVKGGGVKRRDDGMWEFHGRDGVNVKTDGPFRQAQNAMYSLRDNYFSDSMKTLLFGYGVAFPDIKRFDNTDPDADQAMVFDCRYNENVVKYIRCLSDYYREKHGRLHYKYKLPDNNDIVLLKDKFRRVFDLTEPLSVKIGKANDRAIVFTDRQYEIVDGLSSNKRCLIIGPAGTGKSLLASKDAKENVGAGKRVGMFCFNLLLQEELRTGFANNSLSPAFVGSLTDFCERLAAERGLVDPREVYRRTADGISHFYNVELPEIMLRVLSENPIKFDKLIIDEIQDLLTEEYLIVMDQLLEGGLENGEWYFYGDFDCQNIFKSDLDTDKAKQLLKEYTNDYVVYKLSMNCRNTPTIQAAMNKVLGLDYKTLSSEDRYFPAVAEYDYTEETAKRKLEECLGDIIAKGVPKGDITILSPHTFKNSIARYVTKYKVTDYICGGNEISFTTIWKFKGVENNVVILTDITDEATRNPKLLYSGMSRAKGALYVFRKKDI